MSLWLDQYGNRFYADTLKALRAQIGRGGSRVSLMYVDKKDGPPVRVGYVIGGHWLRQYAPVERKA